MTFEYRSNSPPNVDLHGITILALRPGPRRADTDVIRHVFGFLCIGEMLG